MGAVDILGFERVVLLKANRDEHRLKAQRWAGMAADEMAHFLDLPLKRTSGAVALAVLEHRDFHVPQANSPTYGPMAGEELLRLTQCVGYAVASVRTIDGSVFGVLYADGGAEGDDISAEQANELSGLAQQIGLILGMAQKVPLQS